MQSRPFADFARLGERLAATGGRLERTRLVAEYLRGLDPSEAEIAARLLTGRAFPEAQGRRLALSGRAVWDAMRAAGATPEGLDWAGAEDFGELVRHAMAEHPPAGTPLTLADLAAAFSTIATAAGAGSRGRKIAMLADVFRRATAVEAKYVAKIVIGEMRHGVQEGILLDAIAQLANANPVEIRRAQQALGDVGRLARVAMTEGHAGLSQVAVQLFHPIKPMLAQTASDVGTALAEHAGRSALEWKLDGARVQIHKRGEEVRLFSRRLKDITTSLPDVAGHVARMAAADTAIFEGEVIPVAGGRPLPFQELMRRFRRIRDVEGTAAEVPVQLYLFDLLQLGDDLLLNAPEQARWERLQRARGSLDCVSRLVTNDAAEGERFFAAAVAAGYEGVMAKAIDAPYTPGVRGKGWLKIKKVVSLDLVVVAADWGYGRRHGWLSNYHLAARDETTGAFVPIGKTFKGLADAQFRAMTERLLALEIRREHGTVFVRPAVVVEVLFNDIQRSPQYDCGMALRFARIARIRDDKRAEDADTIATVRMLFEKQAIG